MTTELERFNEIFPGIPWSDPIQVTTTAGATGYACRMCVAKSGLRGSDVPDLPVSEEYVRQHIQEAHS